MDGVGSGSIIVGISSSFSSLSLLHACMLVDCVYDSSVYIVQYSIGMCDSLHAFYIYAY